MYKVENGRMVEAEIDYDSDGNAYFSGGWYVDGLCEPVDDDVLDELNELHREDLEEAALEHASFASEEAFERSQS